MTKSIKITRTLKQKIEIDIADDEEPCNLCNSDSTLETVFYLDSDDSSGFFFICLGCITEIANSKKSLILQEAKG